ncbi:subtilisin-like protease SBT1.2 [Tanacetum coccineum]
MTQNPRFFGLHKKSGSRKLSSFGKGMIIRVLDIGIVLTHASFSHHGMLHPLSKWKGLCELDASSCNDKIIGARSLNIGATALNVKMKVESPLDDSGYGTHTLSYLTMLRFIDQQLRQQKHVQQFGVTRHQIWRPQRGIPESFVSILRAWLFEHFLNP